MDNSNSRSSAAGLISSLDTARHASTTPVVVMRWLIKHVETDIDDVLSHFRFTYASKKIENIHSYAVEFKCGEVIDIIGPLFHHKKSDMHIALGIGFGTDATAIESRLVRLSMVIGAHPLHPLASKYMPNEMAGYILKRSINDYAQMTFSGTERDQPELPLLPAEQLAPVLRNNEVVGTFCFGMTPNKEKFVNALSLAENLQSTLAISDLNELILYRERERNKGEVYNVEISPMHPLSRLHGILAFGVGRNLPRLEETLPGLIYNCGGLPIDHRQTLPKQIVLSQFAKLRVFMGALSEYEAASNSEPPQIRKY